MAIKAITLTSAEFPADIPIGTFIGQLGVEFDAGTDANPVFFTLVRSDWDTLGINGNWIYLADNAGIDPYKNPMVYFTVSATDSNGNTCTQSMSLAVRTSGTSLGIRSVSPMAWKIGSTTKALLRGKGFSKGGAVPTVDIVRKNTDGTEEFIDSANVITTELYSDQTMFISIPDMSRHRCCDYSVKAYYPDGTKAYHPILTYKTEEFDTGNTQYTGLNCNSKVGMSLLYSAGGANDLETGSQPILPPMPREYILVTATLFTFINTQTAGLPVVPVIEKNSDGGVDSVLGNIQIREGDYVRLTAQADSSENGIWIASAGAWSKKPDPPAGMGTFVDGGAWPSNGNIRAVMVDMQVDFAKIGTYAIHYYYLNGCVLTRIRRRVMIANADTSQTPGEGYAITDYKVCVGLPDFVKPQNPYVDTCDMDPCGVPNAATPVLSDGSVAMTGNLDMGGNRIINLADPADPTDAVNLRTLQEYFKLNNMIGFRYVAGEHIYAGQAVYMAIDGMVYRAVNTNLDIFGRVLGIATQESNAGGMINVATIGAVRLPLSLRPGMPYYLGNDGMVTMFPPQNYVQDYIEQILGLAISQTDMMLLPRDPVLKPRDVMPPTDVIAIESNNDLAEMVIQSAMPDSTPEPDYRIQSVLV